MIDINKLHKQLILRNVAMDFTVNLVVYCVVQILFHPLYNTVFVCNMDNVTIH